MTENQKMRIKELREKGLGYQAIANQLGISRDSVRYFCRTNDLAGKKSDRKPRVNKKGVFCLFCNAPITQTDGKRQKQFCSDKCRVSWWNNRYKETGNASKGKVKTKCKNCGKHFYSYPSKNRKFCSIDCYMSSRFKGDKKNG